MFFFYFFHFYFYLNLLHIFFCEFTSSKKQLFHSFQYNHLFRIPQKFDELFFLFPRQLFETFIHSFNSVTNYFSSNS